MSAEISEHISSGPRTQATKERPSHVHHHDDRLTTLAMSASGPVTRSGMSVRWRFRRNFWKSVGSRATRS